MSSGKFCFCLSQIFQLNLLLSAGCLGLLQQILQLSHSLLQLCDLQLRILKLRDRISCLGQQTKRDCLGLLKLLLQLCPDMTGDFPFRKPWGNCIQQRRRKSTWLGHSLLAQVCPDIAATCWLCF